MNRLFLVSVFLLGGCFLSDRFHPNATDAGVGDDMSIANGDAGDTDMSMASLCQPSCGGTTPICDTTSTMCRACGSNPECAAATNSTLPVCSTSGACVGCAGNTDCPATAPICNVASGSCGPCTQHTQCTSGVCYQGTCLDSAKVVYVNATGGGCPAGPGMGTMAAPYCTVQKGFDIGAGQNKYVAVLSGTYQPATGAALGVNNPAGDYVVTGIGVGNPVLTVSTTQGSVVAITNTTTNRVAITMDGFVMTGGSGDGQGGGPGAGVDVNGGSDKSRTALTVTHSTLRNNDFQGASVVNGTLVLDHDMVSQNSSIGVLANTSSVTVTNSSVSESGKNGPTSTTPYSAVPAVALVGSTVVMDKVIVGPKNGGRGLDLESSAFTITNTVVYQNGQTGVDYGVFITNGTQPNQTLFNVTVADNIATAPGITCSTTQPTIANTVVFNNPVPNQARIAMCTVTNSAFFGATGSNQDTNNCTDKVFVNAGTANYVPLTGGAPPCSLVGQGVNSVTPAGGTLVTTDHDVVGHSRPPGKYDIGAYQSP